MVIIVSEVVMIVDADRQICHLAGVFLRDAGYSVEVSHDGYDALDRARKTPPNFVLTDMMLPKLDGLALCRLLKSDSATENIVTIIVFSVLEVGDLSFKAGADGFVRKPLEKTRLILALEEARKNGRVYEQT